ncbi:MAG: glycosyltransferase family 4 protein, partial [Phycisphaerales bacterium]
DALPTVLLEALASGCPAVSTRLSGVPEIIEDKVSGILVEPGDDKALARAIRRVLTDDDIAGALSRGGRRRAGERFDIRANVAVMHKWLREVAIEDGDAENVLGRPFESGHEIQDERMVAGGSDAVRYDAPACKA